MASAELPGSVLFACTLNSIRSPMAEAIMKFLHGRKIYVQSAGVRAGAADPFVAEVLDEVGIELSRHEPRTFEEIESRADTPSLLLTSNRFAKE